MHTHTHTHTLTLTHTQTVCIRDPLSHENIKLRHYSFFLPSDSLATYRSLIGVIRGLPVKRSRVRCMAYHHHHLHHTQVYHQRTIKVSSAYTIGIPSPYTLNLYQQRIREVHTNCLYHNRTIGIPENDEYTLPCVMIPLVGPRQLSNSGSQQVA